MPHSPGSPRNRKNTPKPSAEVEIEKTENTLHVADRTGLIHRPKSDSRTVMLTHDVSALKKLMNLPCRISILTALFCAVASAA
jgi:hypothetical protein